MKSVATRRFWELFRALPLDVQKLAVKNYRLWRENPNHPTRAILAGLSRNRKLAGVDRNRHPIANASTPACLPRFPNGKLYPIHSREWGLKLDMSQLKQGAEITRR